MFTFSSVSAPTPCGALRNQNQNRKKKNLLLYLGMSPALLFDERVRIMTGEGCRAEAKIWASKEAVCCSRQEGAARPWVRLSVIHQQWVSACGLAASEVIGLVEDSPDQL